MSYPIDKHVIEPFRDELVRFLPILWVLVQVCNRNGHGHSFWNSQVIDGDGLGTQAYSAIHESHTHNYSAVHYIQCCRRVETKRLLYHHFQIFDSLCCFIDITILFAKQYK